MSDDLDWKEFERLIARIESVLAPKGAIVKLNDRVPDIFTGRKRQVDATIRFQVGSVSVLITVECRRRKKVSDDTWIEQLITKKQKIGASETIAISSKGLSAQAKETARMMGIQVRNITEVDSNEIESWLKQIEFNSLGIVIKVLKISCLNDQLEEFVFEPLPPMNQPYKGLIRVFDKMAMSPYVFMNKTINSIPDLFSELPKDGRKIRYELDCELPKNALILKNAKKINALTRFSFSIECHYETKTEIIQGKTYKYESPQGLIAYHTEFLTEIQGIPFVVIAQNQGK